MRHLAQPGVSQAMFFQKGLQTLPMLAHRLTGELQNPGILLDQIPPPPRLGSWSYLFIQKKLISHPGLETAELCTVVLLGKGIGGVASRRTSH